MNYLKLTYIILGTLSLCLGVTGIIIPGLPTTPFLLLAAWLYMRGSDRLYYKLVTNKFLGRYILDYNRNKGMTLKAKVYAVALMGVMIAVSSFCFIQSLTGRVIILALGIIGCIVVTYFVPTVNIKFKQ
jgi:uncharacterized membrane protein YbaN (DUF454 family)